MAFNPSARAEEIIGLFQNALIYTVVLRNIDGLVADKDNSIVLIIMSTAIGAAGVYLLQCTVQIEAIAVRDVSHFAPLLDLADFVLQVSGNILVQLTSSLAATLAIAVFSSAKTLLWGFCGAFASLTLLWLLRETVTAVAVTRVDNHQTGR